jgi:hypothetical protein
MMVTPTHAPGGSISNAAWTQKGTLSVQLQVGASGSGTTYHSHPQCSSPRQGELTRSTPGVQLGNYGQWTQDGAATIHVTNSSSGYGVYLNGVSATWQQNGPLTIETEYSGAGACDPPPRAARRFLFSLLMR